MVEAAAASARAWSVLYVCVLKLHVFSHVCAFFAAAFCSMGMPDEDMALHVTAHSDAYMTLLDGAVVVLMVLCVHEPAGLVTLNPATSDSQHALVLSAPG